MTVNNEMRDLIIEGLNRNREKYGVPYCPCKLPKIIDNICPCKEFRETGNCECGLYVTKGGN